VIGKNNNYTLFNKKKNKDSVENIKLNYYSLFNRKKLNNKNSIKKYKILNIQ